MKEDGRDESLKSDDAGRDDPKSTDDVLEFVSLPSYLLESFDNSCLLFRHKQFMKNYDPGRRGGKSLKKRNKDRLVKIKCILYCTGVK
jgi:hypothetical protein